MSARIVSRIAFGIGVVAIAVVPCVPMIYRWFNPPRTPVPDPQGFWQTMGSMLDLLGSFTDGIVMLVWICGLGVTALLASIIAFAAACAARESLAWRLLCGLPVLLGAALWMALLLFG